MEFLFMLFLRGLAELIWPTQPDDSADRKGYGGNDVFIPFSDHTNNSSDPYFPDDNDGGSDDGDGDF